LFDCGAPKELQVMAINSHDVKAVVHNQYFFMDFDLVCGDEEE